MTPNAPQGYPFITFRGSAQRLNVSFERLLDLMLEAQVYPFIRRPLHVQACLRLNDHRKLIGPRARRRSTESPYKVSPVGEEVKFFFLSQDDIEYFKSDWLMKKDSFWAVGIQSGDTLQVLNSLDCKEQHKDKGYDNLDFFEEFVLYSSEGSDDRDDDFYSKQRVRAYIDIQKDDILIMSEDLERLLKSLQDKEPKGNPFTKRQWTSAMLQDLNTAWYIFSEKSDGFNLEEVRQWLRYKWEDKAGRDVVDSASSIIISEEDNNDEQKKKYISPLDLDREIEKAPLGLIKINHYARVLWEQYQTDGHYPKRDTIIGDLKAKNFGRRVAGSVATIIRPDELKR